MVTKKTATKARRAPKGMKKSTTNRQVRARKGGARRKATSTT